MTRRKWRFALPALIGATAAPSLRAVTVNQTGSFQSEVDRLKSLAFADGSNLYIPPTTAQLNSFSTLAANLWSGNFRGAGSTSLDTDAATLGYEYVRFTDTDTGNIFYGLREKLVSGVTPKGWGSYYVNFNPLTNSLTEVPHV